MEEAFRALLLGSSGLTALVGSRINWGAQPQGQPWPGIVLRLVSDFDGMTISGPMKFKEARVQVDAFALDYGTATQMARLIEARLNGHFGGIFDLIAFLDRRATREDGPTEADRPYRQSLDFRIHYRS